MTDQAHTKGKDLPVLKTKFNSSKNWYAVYTRSRSEKKVYNQLTLKGINAFLPLHKTIRQWSQRRKMVEVPYIPGYCFVQISLKQYLDVLKTDNVIAFVKHCQQPAIIPDNQILFLKKVLSQDEFSLEFSMEKFVAGDSVIIANGPFTGIQGELISKRGKHKFMVRIDQLNCSLLLEISLKDVEILRENVEVYA